MSELQCPSCKFTFEADLVSALRGEGILVVEDKGDAIERIGLLTTDSRWSHIEAPLLMSFALAVLDALAEAQPE